jgi:hypothetical protein
MLQNIELLVVNERQETMRRDGDRYRLAAEANWQPGYSRLFHQLRANIERLISAASTRQSERKIIADQPPSSRIRLSENDQPTRRAA